MLLIWLQLVWVITLAGAVICYSSQNIFQFNFANEASKISLGYRRRVVLAIATVIVKRFDAGLPAPSAADLIHSYGFPARLVGDAIDRLTRCKLVSHVIIDERHGSHDFVPDFGRRFPGVEAIYESITTAIQSTSSGTLLRDLEIAPVTANTEKNV